MDLRSPLPPPVGPRGLRGLSIGSWPSAAFFLPIGEEARAHVCYTTNSGCSSEQFASEFCAAAVTFTVCVVLWYKKVKVYIKYLMISIYLIVSET